MVEFELKPIEKVVIHEILKWTLDEFTKKLVKPNSAFQWTSGVVMQRRVYQTVNPKMMEDEINGITHWAVIEFAEMPEFKPQLINDITNAVGIVNDVSNNNLFMDFVRWLRSDSRWFPKDSN